ncbi:MAG: hypothetical protein KIT64_08815 [Chitinophagaceae bacterium]|nr:hypothetical protein [Chitinophagaceae bacterium]
MKNISLQASIYFILAVAVLLLSLLLPNAWMVSLGLIILAIITATTWKPYLPNVFFFILAYHLLQVITFPLYINYSWNGNVDYNTEHAVKAFIVALIGILVLWLVIVKLVYKNVVITKEIFEIHVAQLNPKKVLIVYLFLYFIANIAGTFADSGVLRQVFINIQLLKWMGFVLLGYVSIRSKVYRLYFFIAFSLEFVGGFFSFFSSFKMVFFYTAIILMTYVRNISLKTVVQFFTIGTFLFIIIVYWTAIKGEYRAFLNQGTKTQTVQVSQSDAFNKLNELASSVSTTVFNETLGDLYYRLQYVFHLSKAMDIVPSEVPYQNGSVWGENIKFVLVPRFLDPDKGTIDASLKTSKFTGIEFAGVDKGTSISLGYFGDCYVDFGIPGMFAVLAIIAFMWVRIYRYFLLKATSNLVVNYSITIAFFVQFAYFESDGTFMLGRLYTTFVVFFLFKILFFKRIERYITSW